MPQFNFADALPQIVWLVVIFSILYLSLTRLLPKVERIVEDRKDRIAADLRAAEAARSEAEDASSGGSNAISDARSRSLAVTGRARDEAAAATAHTLARIDADLAAKAEAAAQGLATAKATAVAELDAVATEAAVDLIARVAGVSISNDEAAGAVRKAAA